MPWAIECDDLARHFGARAAVDGLTLRVSAGEVYALLGPNGAGKTTTVRVLACLLRPSRGAARVLGFDVAREPAAVRRRVGLLTEAPGLYDRLSPRETLRFHADLQEVARPAARVAELLADLGLEGHADVPAATLSKGLKQRVALARALLHEPPVIFLDEPTAGLDVPTQRQVRELVHALRARGRAIVLTTHNLDEAERLADRIGVLSGRLLAEGTADQLRSGAGGNRVRVELEVASAALLAAARQVPGLADAALDGSTLTATAADGGAVPDLVEALVNAGGRVRGVALDRASLEEVYLRLVDPSAERPGAAEGAA